MLDFLDNKAIQASGHAAQGYAEVVLRRDLSAGYKELVTALALLKVSDIVPKVMADVEAKAVQLENVKGGQAGPSK